MNSGFWLRSLLFTVMLNTTAVVSVFAEEQVFPDSRATAGVLSITVKSSERNQKPLFIVSGFIDLHRSRDQSRKSEIFSDTEHKMPGLRLCQSNVLKFRSA